VQLRIFAARLGSFKAQYCGWLRPSTGKRSFASGSPTPLSRVLDVLALREVPGSESKEGSVVGGASDALETHHRHWFQSLLHRVKLEAVSEERCQPVREAQFALDGQTAMSRYHRSHQELSAGQCSSARFRNRSFGPPQGRHAPIPQIRRLSVRTLFPLFSTATYPKTAQTLDTYVIMELWNLPSDFSHSGVAHLLSTCGLQATAIPGRLWAVGCRLCARKRCGVFSAVGRLKDSGTDADVCGV